MAVKRNLKYELEILKSHSTHVKEDPLALEYVYVKKALIWSVLYIIIAVCTIFIASVYLSDFPFDYSLRIIFHIHQILL